MSKLERDKKEHTAVIIPTSAETLPDEVNTRVKSADGVKSSLETKKTPEITGRDKKIDGAASELSIALEGRSVEVRAEALTVIQKAFRAIGISVEDYCQAVKGGLKAKRTVTLKDGSYFEEPDHQVRLKAATMGFELEGYLKARVSNDGTTNNYFDVKTLVQQWRGIK